MPTPLIKYGKHGRPPKGWRHAARLEAARETMRVKKAATPVATTVSSSSAEKKPLRLPQEQQQQQPHTEAMSVQEEHYRHFGNDRETVAGTVPLAHRNDDEIPGLFSFMVGGSVIYVRTGTY